MNISATVTLTLRHTALCDILDLHLKDGRRHGMDTYLLDLVSLTRILWTIERAVMGARYTGHCYRYSISKALVCLRQVLKKPGR
jgi:hypothetical protein